LTLFPEIFPQVLSYSILGRAQKKNLVKIQYVNIRDFATGKHKSVDDKPYGGGVGMIMRVDVLEKAIEKSRTKSDQPLAEKIKEKVVLLDPTGKMFNQATARRYSKLDHLILVCGHYEGVDGRIYSFVDEVISIGNYILSGGEGAAIVVVDAAVRLIPRVLTKKNAVVDESFSRANVLEHPQYTRPAVYKGLIVPKILLSGDHQKILEWQKNQSKTRSKKVDPSIRQLTDSG